MGARPGRPFSNSTEWEIWSYNVCHGAGNDARRCVNDDGEDCPLIALSLTDRTPAEWTGPRGRYRCTEKTTPAAARRQAEADERAAVEAEHYPLFEVPAGVTSA
ncbi:hypothetical protein ACW2Q0_00675 [Nocardia sp. R16R-3T]